MRRASILAAAMVIAACHSRNEDQTGAAPETTGDEGVTHAIDTTRTGPPGTGGRPSDGTVTMDSVVSDSARVVPDTSGTGVTPSPSSAPQDTLGPRSLDDGSAPGEADTTGWSGTSGMDSSATDTTGGYR